MSFIVRDYYSSVLPCARQQNIVKYLHYLNVISTLLTGVRQISHYISCSFRESYSHAVYKQKFSFGDFHSYQCESVPGCYFREPGTILLIISVRDLGNHSGVN